MDKLKILSSLDPTVFEEYVAKYILPVLELKVLTIIGSPNDRGCDIIAEDVRFGSKVCVQVKRYSRNNKVSRIEILKVKDGMEYYGCKRGLIITTSELSGSALKEADENGIEYIPGTKLIELIEQNNLPIPLTYSENEYKDEPKDVESKKVRDDGVFIPLTVDKAIEIAKKSLSSTNVRLENVEAYLKQLYVFKVKVSFRLKGRKSRCFIVTVDGDNNISIRDCEEGSPTLSKTIDCEVNYEKEPDFYHKARSIAVKYARDQIPTEATDIKDEVELREKAWVVSYYLLFFKVGLTSAVVKVDRKGKAEVNIKPLTEEDIRKAYGGSVSKRGNSWLVVREDEKFTETIILNEVGEQVDRKKVIKEGYARKLITEIDKGNVVYINGNEVYSDHGDFLNECIIDQNENVQCQKVGIGSSKALSIAQEHFTSTMFAKPMNNSVNFNGSWEVKLLGTTGEVEYHISLDGNLKVNRKVVNENYAKLFLYKYPIYTVRREEDKIIGGAEDDKYIYYFEWALDGNLIANAKRIKAEYAEKIVREFFHLNSGVARYKYDNDGVKIDITFNGYHYLAKVDNEGRVINSLILPDVTIYPGIEKGYNKKNKCLIVKSKEGNKEVIYRINDNGVIDKKEISRFGKLVFGVKNVFTSDYSIDTNDPLDLI